MSNLLQRRADPSAFLPENGARAFEQARPAFFRPVWQSTVGRLAAWLERERERRSSIARLQHLSDWLLRDVGIERNDIEDSVDRHLWEMQSRQHARTGRDIYRGP